MFLFYVFGPNYFHAGERNLILAKIAFSCFYFMFLDLIIFHAGEIHGVAAPLAIAMQIMLLDRLLH